MKSNSIQFSPVKPGSWLYQARELPQFFYCLNSALEHMIQSAPASLSMAQTWHDYNGLYLFTKTALTSGSDSWEAYTTALETYIAGELTKPDKIHYPEGSVFFKGFAWLNDQVKTSGPVIEDGFCTLVLRNGAQYITTVAQKPGFGALQLPIRVSLQVFPAAGPGQYAADEHNIRGFVLTYQPQPGSVDLPQPQDQWYLSLQPESCGSLSGQLALRRSAFWKASGKKEPFPWAGGFRTSIQGKSQFYPLWMDEPSEFMLYEVSWRPYMPDRSTLSFKDRSITLTSSEAGGHKEIAWPKRMAELPAHLLAFGYPVMAFPSAFRTVAGQTVWLIPQPGAKLVVRPYKSTEGQGYMLVPEGAFEIAMGQDFQLKPGQSIELICGLTGTEFIEVMPRYEAFFGDLITFTVVASGPFSAEIQITPNPLNATQTAPVYYAQPREASLFKAMPQQAPGIVSDQAIPENDQVVEPGILVAAQLQNTLLSSSTPSFPMLPYGNLHLTEGLMAKDISDSEWDISRQRKANIDKQPSQSTGEGKETTAATPQGFVVSYAGNGMNWKSVTLATDGTQSFGFVPAQGQNYLPSELRNALQANQLFLVISQANTKLLGELKGQLTIDGWPFDALNPKKQGARDYSNMLIFKFAEGSLASLAQNTEQWNMADKFNKNKKGAEEASAWLYDYIETAEREVNQGNDSGSNENSWLVDFVNKVNDSAWNGVMVLKVNISVEQFPEALEGIVAGLDLSRFYGHHMGFSASTVAASNGTITLQRSSLFALIDYVDTDQGRPSSPDSNQGQNNTTFYSFRVKRLQVLFRNSKVQHFSSVLQLTANSWFGEPAVLNQNTGIQGFGTHTIDMYGHLEHHYGTEIYTFVTKPGQVYRFNMQSQVLSYVEITQAKFVTLHVTPAQNGKKDIKTHFILSGYLHFKELPLDLFSFGTRVSSPNGLAFHELMVDMNFSIDDSSPPPVVENLKFSFDPAKITFDLDRSSAREESIYQKFPLSLSRLLYSEGNEGSGNTVTPAAQGFLPMSLKSSSPTGALGSTWYGLEYQLNLGTPGALASKMDFTAHLLAAWSPGGDQLQLYAGMKLPGTGGAKNLLGLENVIKLSIDQILLENQGGPEQAAYVLSFFNIGLKFFGIHLPLHGALNAALFANPDSTADAKEALGWYAAYDNLNNE